jgi:hypothetical protein
LIDQRPRPVETGGHSPPHAPINLSLQTGSKTMTSKLILIAAAALITAPATAKGTDDTPKANKTAASEQKYCIEYEKMTGSRVSRQECRTKKQWAEEGVDVDEMMKK